MTEWNPRSTPSFTRREMTCRCGCGRADMDGNFMDFLQAVRARTGPMHVNSGYRCPAHNARVSATGANGPHTTGRAADIRCSGAFAHRLVREAVILGATGIGVAQQGPHESRFVHIDTLTPAEATGCRPWIWSY
ncbi:MAG: DUF882 domain-containing protein [Alphaproteobacteria bacterium]|nr:DUF882 domain-containing protein [Alphaproteobacteria bacterium]